MYFEIGSPVAAASMVTAGLRSLPETRSIITSSYHASPVARPQPPSRQWTCTLSRSAVSKRTSTRVQSCVPVSGGV